MMGLHRTGLMLTLVVALMALLVPAAAADQVYHSTHIPLSPVTNAPLRSGFVENIHANGPRIFAHENYQLNGAQAKITYYVSINFFGTDDCSGPIGATFDEAMFMTNSAGNGEASSVVGPGLIDQLGLHDTTVYAKWFVSTDHFSDAGGTVQYETVCVAATLD